MVKKRALGQFSQKVFHSPQRMAMPSDQMGSPIRRVAIVQGIFLTIKAIFLGTWFSIVI